VASDSISTSFSIKIVQVHFQLLIGIVALLHFREKFGIVISQPSIEGQHVVAVRLSRIAVRE
jgi:hypothetical protein